MEKNHTIIGIYLEETPTFTFNEVCQKYHIPDSLLLEMVEYGLFSNLTTQREELKLTPKDLTKIESAFRLHKDLGINLSGVALALELLDQIEQLNNELNILRKHII